MSTLHHCHCDKQPRSSRHTLGRARMPRSRKGGMLREYQADRCKYRLLSKPRRGIPELDHHLDFHICQCVVQFGGGVMEGSLEKLGGLTLSGKGDMGFL